MYRRCYLGALGAVGVAGCSGSAPNTETPPTDTPPPIDGDGGPASTPTDIPTESPTDSPTPTATPTPSAPRVEFVSLVSSWEGFGDAMANQIDAAPQNSEIQIGWREETWVHDGTYNTTSQAKIFDSQGNRVAVAQDRYQEITSGSDPQE